MSPCLSPAGNPSEASEDLIAGPASLSRPGYALPRILLASQNALLSAEHIVLRALWRGGRKGDRERSQEPVGRQREDGLDPGSRLC